MFGKRKVEQAQFEGELEGLLKLFPAWGGETQPPPALIARFNEFRRIVPDRKSSQLLSRLLCETTDNQIKAMSHLAIAMSKKDNFLASAKELRIGQTYLARMNRAAEVLVRHVATLDESDPMRKFLIDYGFYDPSGGAQPPSAEPPSTAERSHALDFLRALQWATSRQQLAMEEWNDAVATEVTGSLGDEIREVPTFNLNAANAPRLMPVAQRRLASAQLVRDEFAKLKSGRLPDSVSTAVDAWARAFDMHLRRCEITVRNLGALIAGTPDGGENDADLVPDESLLGDQAVAAEGAVMQRYGIDFAELQGMMVTACNILRSELGKPPLSFEEYGEIFKMGETGQRPRFYA